MIEIPVNSTADQQLSVVLAGQNCVIRIYTLSTGMYLDLSVDGNQICTGSLIWGNALIVKNRYNGFSGNLMILDTQGTDNPVYSGLGSRFVLMYVEDSGLE